MMVRMKESVLRETRASTPPRRRHRALVAVVTVIALLGIGTGGAFALGIVPSPFRADPVPTLSPSPTPTPSVPAPTVSPTATPPTPTTAAPVFSAPTPTVPLSCAELGAAIDLTALMSDPVEGSPTLFTPEDAALRQAGVESCWWSSAEFSLLQLDVATDPSAGLADVADGLANGATPLDVGDASMVSCEQLSAGCSASIVSGSYWMNIHYQGANVASETAPALLQGTGRSLIDALGEQPIPLQPWTMPPTTWSPVTECSALETSVPMATILQSPLVVGPAPLNPGSKNGIQRTQPDSYACRWSVPDGETPADGEVSALTVQLAPGARWAYPATSGAGIEPLAVDGAQDAGLECQSAEGVEQCWLNVLTDDSWLQLGSGDGFSPDQGQLLVAAAEAILAAHG
ncbi:hypothetical protein B7R21_08895 [Subtercola boreus]|uniref:DUF3558 domain-containing protein n=2 Tax=Subtercola boreus TaxID=120213 RepID=A0A3E0VTK8_9MICO|nr:hypothetical protein B7R21_08895 [Subtercola boreus]